MVSNHPTSIVGSSFNRLPSAPFQPAHRRQLLLLDSAIYLL